MAVIGYQHDRENSGKSIEYGIRSGKQRVQRAVKGGGTRQLADQKRETGYSSTYKIMQGIDKVRPEILFTRVGERQEARTRLSADPLNLKTQLSNLDIRKHSFAVRVVENWNKLDKEVKNIKTGGMFINAI